MHSNYVLPEEGTFGLLVSLPTLLPCLSGNTALGLAGLSGLQPAPKGQLDSHQGEGDDPAQHGTGFMLGLEMESGPRSGRTAAEAVQSPGRVGPTSRPSCLVQQEEVWPLLVGPFCLGKGAQCSQQGFGRLLLLLPASN